ncbi:MAG: hypothetical protein KC766_21100 [Myxococcales bacterium]|nr:hypothetical protein [Myxococcales bacterium]
MSVCDNVSGRARTWRKLLAAGWAIDIETDGPPPNAQPVPRGWRGRLAGAVFDPKREGLLDCPLWFAGYAWRPVAPARRYGPPPPACLRRVALGLGDSGLVRVVAPGWSVVLPLTLAAPIVELVGIAEDGRAWRMTGRLSGRHRRPELITLELGALPDAPVLVAQAEPAFNVSHVSARDALTWDAGRTAVTPRWGCWCVPEATTRDARAAFALRYADESIPAVAEAKAVAAKRGPRGE